MKKKFYFVKNKVSLVFLLIVGFSFVAYLFPFNAIHAAKIQSGVTVTAPAAGNPAQPAGTCTDSNNDGVDDVTGAPCSPLGGAAAGTCGPLQIVSGIPINYGQVTFQQPSAQKQVVIKNVGTSQIPAKVMINDANWVPDAGVKTTDDPYMAFPTHTHVTSYPNEEYWQQRSLTPIPQELGRISGGQSLSIYFQYYTYPGKIGSYHQFVTIDLVC